MVDLKELQERIYNNKVSKGFNTDDVCKEFCYTYAELSEAFEAYRKELGNVGEELADVAIFVLGLSEILNINLEEEILKKLDKNEKRNYKSVNGFNVRVEE